MRFFKGVLLQQIRPSQKLHDTVGNRHRYKEKGSVDKPARDTSKSLEAARKAHNM